MREDDDLPQSRLDSPPLRPTHRMDRSTNGSTLGVNDAGSHGGSPVGTEGSTNEHPTNHESGIAAAGAARRTALSCMAWAGAGLLWTMHGGVPVSEMLGGSAQARVRDQRGFTFVQVSDSHIGFNKDPLVDPTATFDAAMDRIGAMPDRPAFMIHTGDVSHLSKPAEFDAARQIVSKTRLETYYVPGEHDVLVDDGKGYFSDFAPKGRRGGYSFDYEGVHFIGLTNVLDLRGGGLGYLGAEQLDWLQRDLHGQSNSTPLIVFAHIPLWSLYPAWGWGTDDSARALAMMQRFGSVTVLNGHVHQIAQKVEGTMTFYSARSTAFPQPAPGTAAGPGPMKVSAGILPSLLGIRDVRYVAGLSPLAVTDTSLEG